MAHDFPFWMQLISRCLWSDGRPRPSSARIRTGEDARRSTHSVGGHRYSHILDHASGKLTSFHFGSTFHQALEVVGYFFLLDSALQALLDQIGGFRPSEIAEHHDAGQNDRAGNDDVLVGVLGSGAVSGFEDGIAS